ncbi:hypothetical protein BV140_958 [Haemophilus influenzae]|nr:hypothetical protein BV083_900 [Haemophilus influenzae]AVI97712.1 hypothetical protein BV085_898 [Haemophilus influenzae]AVJ06731.1 hypothetical protein BV139_957 [Haemophilus influenzae]AVJ08564.1 hypothetical protein BV140_958 [Haemophilus influenzae]
MHSQGRAKFPTGGKAHERLKVRSIFGKFFLLNCPDFHF